MVNRHHSHAPCGRWGQASSRMRGQNLLESHNGRGWDQAARVKSRSGMTSRSGMFPALSVNNRSHQRMQRQSSV